MLLNDKTLRFETLLWGGDEAKLVLPAWKVPDLLKLLLEDMNDPEWKFGSTVLTNGIGILVCHAKTPIARALSLAEEIVVDAKNLNSDSSIKDVAVHTVDREHRTARRKSRVFPRAALWHSESKAFAVHGREQIQNFVESHGADHRS